MTSTITWYTFPDVRPPVVYERSQNGESRVFYFVALPRQQVTILQWHANRGGHPAGQWEWPNGKRFNGDVLMWASEPTLM
jgi:hypothetical protein